MIHKSSQKLALFVRTRDCYSGTNHCKALVGWAHGDPPLSPDQFPLGIDFNKKIISDRNPSTLSNICLFQPRRVSIFVTSLAFLGSAVHPSSDDQTFHFSTQFELCLFLGHLSEPIRWNLSRVRPGDNEWEVECEDWEKEKVYIVDNVNCLVNRGQQYIYQQFYQYLKIYSVNYQKYYRYRKMHQIWSDKFMESKTHISQENVGTMTLSCLLTMKILCLFYPSLHFSAQHLVLSGASICVKIWILPIIWERYIGIFLIIGKLLILIWSYRWL